MVAIFERICDHGLNTKVNRLTVIVSEPAAENLNSSLSLHQLLTEVDDAVRTALPATYWVRAEILNVRHNRYWAIELSSYEGGNKAKATAMIWQSQANIVAAFESASGTKLQKGLKILIRVDVAYHAEYGLRLNVREFDPVFSLGDMEARLNQIRQRLQTLNEVDLNRNLSEPQDFTSVAVIAPRDAAGLGDFRSQADLLQKNNLCSFSYYEALFQSEKNADSLIAAMQQVIKDNNKKNFDVIVIIRGGGDKAGLYELNKIKIARGVCRAPIPVFVGIGHERDSTILDELANRTFATPSLVIAHLLSAIIDNARGAGRNYLQIYNQTRLLLENAQRDCKSLNDRILRQANESLNQAQRSVFELNRTIRTTPIQYLQHARQQSERRYTAICSDAQATLTAATNRIGNLNSSVLQNARSQLEQCRYQTATQYRQLETNARDALTGSRHSLDSARNMLIYRIEANLTRARNQVDKYAVTIEHLNPTNVLKRGFSLLFSQKGTPITSATALKNEQQIFISMRDGTAQADVIDVKNDVIADATTDAATDMKTDADAN